MEENRIQKEFSAFYGCENPPKRISVANPSGFTRQSHYPEFFWKANNNLPDQKLKSLAGFYTGELIMRNKILLIAIIFCTAFNGLQAMPFVAQDNDKSKTKSDNQEETANGIKQPDVPGALVVEIANNILQNAPDQMKLNAIGSWTVNLYYMYDFPIGNSNFSFNFGFGAGLEKFSFDQDITLATSNDDTETVIRTLDQVFPNASKFKKTKLATNYFDFPLELRFHSNKNNPKKSFKLAAGAKIGIRYDVHNKIKYEENGNTKKIKNFENYNVSNFRYGVYGRLGTSGISLYYYYSLSEMFDNKKGPEDTRANVMMFGISLSGF